MKEMVCAGSIDTAKTATTRKNTRRSKAEKRYREHTSTIRQHTPSKGSQISNGESRCTGSLAKAANKLQSTCQIQCHAFWQHFVALVDLETLVHFPVICTLEKKGETFPKNRVGRSQYNGISIDLGPGC